MASLVASHTAYLATCGSSLVAMGPLLDDIPSHTFALPMAAIADKIVSKMGVLEELHEQRQSVATQREGSAARRTSPGGVRLRARDGRRRGGGPRGRACRGRLLDAGERRCRLGGPRARREETPRRRPARAPRRRPTSGRAPKRLSRRMRLLDGCSCSSRSAPRSTRAAGCASG